MEIPAWAEKLAKPPANRQIQGVGARVRRMVDERRRAAGCASALWAALNLMACAQGLGVAAPAGPASAVPAVSQGDEPAAAAAAGPNPPVVTAVVIAPTAAPSPSVPADAPAPAGSAASPLLAAQGVGMGGVALTVVAPAEPAEPPPPLHFPTPIDDPSGRALAPLHAALARAERGEGQARLLFYGASHTASDMYTDLLRRRLQQRFGEAGPGFVLPAKPWRWYRHAGFEHERNRNWRAVRVHADAPRPDAYGLAGVALDAGEQLAVAAMTAHGHGGLTGQVSRFELYYQLQPNGGRLAVFIDGERVRSFSTAAAQVGAGYAEFVVEDGLHRFELRSQADGPVRVFGVAAERTVPGVLLDTLGIPGSRAAFQLQWNDALYREHLARRAPDLVALAYGTNEAGDDDVPIARYEAGLRAVLARVRQVVPAAACLLIGPTDRPLELEDGTFAVRPRVEAVSAVQRRLAHEHGCGFFDTLGFMGGPLAMTHWVSALPPLGAPDHVHFTRRGYELMGDALFEALLAGYASPVVDATPTVTLSAPGASQTPAAAPCSTACR
jgi:lysophospholipase L1-like esterase